MNIIFFGARIANRWGDDLSGCNLKIRDQTLGVIKSETRCGLFV
jgi:hypothetical protein